MLKIVSGDDLTAVEKAKAGKVTDINLIQKMFGEQGGKPEDMIGCLFCGEAYLVEG